MITLLPLASIAFVISSLPAQTPPQADVLMFSGSVVREDGRPLAGVTIRVKNAGATTTTGEGEFVLPLPRDIRPGHWITVQISPAAWVFTNVYNNRLVVPDRAGDGVTLVVARKGSPSLTSEEKLRQMIQDAVNRQVYDIRGGGITPKPHVQDVIAEQAEELGVPAAVIGRKLDAWAKARQVTGTPYEKGLAAFYAGQYGRALDHLRVAKQAGGPELLAISLMLGQSNQAMLRFSDAVRHFREALALDPSSVDALLGVATTCLIQKALVEDEDDDFFRPEELADCSESGDTYVARVLDQFTGKAEPDLEKYAAVLATFAALGASHEPEFDLDFDAPIDKAREIRIAIERLDSPHVATLTAIALIALLAENEDELRSAVELALQRGEASLGRDFPERPALLLMKAPIAADVAEINRLFREAVSSAGRLGRPDELARTHSAVADLLEKLKADLDDADISSLNKRIERHYFNAIEAVKGAADAGSPMLFDIRSDFALWLLASDRGAEGIRQMHLAYEEGKRIFGAGHWMVRMVRPSLLEAYDDVDFDELPPFQAIPLYRRYLDLIDEPPVDTDKLESGLEHFVEYLLDHGRRTEAAPLQARLEQVKLAEFDKEDPSGDSSATFRARSVLDKHTLPDLRALYVNVCKGTATVRGILENASDERQALAALRVTKGVQTVTSGIRVFSKPRETSASPRVGTVVGDVALMWEGRRSPRSDVRIVLASEGFRAETTSDDKGLFRFSSVREGKHVVLASQKGLRPEIFDVEVSSEGETRVQITLDFPEYGCASKQPSREAHRSGRPTW